MRCRASSRVIVRTRLVAIAAMLASALAVSAESSVSTKAPVPVVIWHGLGDSYTNAGLTQLGDEIKIRYPDTFVHFIHVADNGGGDQRATFFGNANEQIELVCAQLATIGELQLGFDAVGLSQGGQLMRAYIERCNDPPVRTLITLGSQHLGVSETPPCRGPGDLFCIILKRLATSGSVYSDYAQNHIVPAQYFRDQANIDKYLEHNQFLRDINNERVSDDQPTQGSEIRRRRLRLADDDEEPRNEAYKKRFTSLHRFVMFKFSEDHTVIPSTSAWFTLPNVTASPPLPMQPIPLPYTSIPLYTEDYIGLKELDKAGKVKFGECAGEHMHITRACWEDVMDHLGTGKRSVGAKAESSTELIFQP